MNDLEHKGHSHRNYTPNEFVINYCHAESEHERGELRSLFRRLDSGRYYEFLDQGHKVFAHLDLEGREIFASEHPNLMEWLGVFGLIEDLNTFPEYSGIER